MLTKRQQAILDMLIAISKQDKPVNTNQSRKGA